MPSEIVQKENENGIEAKEVIEKTDAKENGTQETKTDGALKVTSEESDGSSKELSESENKENEEPIDDDGEDVVNDDDEEVVDEEEDDEEGEQKDNVPTKERADKFFLSGKRHFLIGDFQAAANDLSVASGINGHIYGEMAIECAESYFMYGCALLELSKNQISPVGLEEKDDVDTSIQEENLSEKNKHNVTNEENQIPEVEEKPDLIKDISEKNDFSDKDTLSSNYDDDLDRKIIDKDDINDLQLAWEMLDLAKLIYKTKNSEETNLILAEVLMKCGEVSIEDEKFDLAIEDMTESLAIRRSLLPEDNRIIAETLFQLGLAHELEGLLDKAVTLLSEALDVLNRRISTLENLTDDKAKEEITEIKAIIPEIRERIGDIKERRRATMEAMCAVVEAKVKTTTNGGASSSTAKPASNISHLVRKRPKHEETDGTPNKISKLESSADKQ